jgi:hypothetical protein
VCPYLETCSRLAKFKLIIPTNSETCEEDARTAGEDGDGSVPAAGGVPCGPVGARLRRAATTGTTVRVQDGAVPGGATCGACEGGGGRQRSRVLAAQRVRMMWWRCRSGEAVMAVMPQCRVVRVQRGLDASGESFG